MNIPSRPISNRLQIGLLVLCCLGLAIPLVVYMLIGTTMRYSGDDYCYAATLTQYGFWGTQQYAYLNIAYYNGNRFSLNLFSALADQAGPYASGVWPALAVVVWLAGLYLVLKRVSKIASIKVPVLKVPALALFLAAEILVFSTLAKTPDIDQSLFWRSGMLPYLAPVIVNTYLSLLLVRQQADHPHNFLELICAAILAFIGAGFSETFALVQAAWLGLAFLIGLVLYWLRKPFRPNLARFMRIAGISWFATLVSLAVLALSPTVLVMKPHLAQPPDWLGTLQLSMLYTRRFLSTLKTAPLENLFPAVMSAALTMLVFYRQLREKSFRLVHLLALLLGLGATAYLLIVTSMAAFAYAQQAYPEPRAEVVPRFILTLAEAAAGSLAGLAADGLVRNARFGGFFAALAGIALIVMLAYPLWIGRVYWGELPRYQRWAEAWDRRDQAIYQARDQGALDIHVMEIDHIIPRVVELLPDPDNHHNRCASVYYGVNSITADLPGWDE